MDNEKFKQLACNAIQHLLNKIDDGNFSIANVVINEHGDIDYSSRKITSTIDIKSGKGPRMLVAITWISGWGFSLGFVDEYKQMTHYDLLEAMFFDLIDQQTNCMNLL